MAYRVGDARRAFFSSSTDTEGLSETEIRRRAFRKKIFEIGKVGVFLLIWAMFTFVLIVTPDFKPREGIVSVSPKVKQALEVSDEPKGDLLTVVLRGKIDVIKTANTNHASKEDKYINVAVETFNTKKNETVWRSNDWRVYIDDSDGTELHTVKDHFQLNENSKSTKLVIMGKKIGSWSDPDVTLQVIFINLGDKSVALSVQINSNPMNTKLSAWLGVILLVFLYVLICFDLTDRTFAAILVATTAIGVLCLLKERPSLVTIIGWIDKETLMLLFGMMIIVAIVADTGIFDFLSVIVYQLSQGRVWRLLFYMYFFTGFVSAFLDNVTVVMLMIPVTIRLCELLAINTSIVLISVAIFSNLGGTLTPVGDPPNIIIASNSDVQSSGINFGHFMLHMFPGVVLAMIVGFVALYYMTRNKLHESDEQLRRSIEELEQQMETNQDSLYSRNLLRHIADLKARLSRKESLPVSRSEFEMNLKEIKAKYKILDVTLTIKCAVAFGLALLMFLFCSVPGLDGIMLGWAAILAAVLLLILIDRPDVDSILERVEWSTLVFFAALFVLMEALVELGLIEFFGDMANSIISSVDDNNQLTMGIFLVLWVSAITSAFVDNIPITTLMLRVTIRLANNKNMHLSLQPLIWALSFGACFGGNGTLIGASANVVTAGIAKQHGYNIKFLLFLIIGFPIMMVTVAVANIYLFIVHCLMTWH